MVEPQPSNGYAIELNANLNPLFRAIIFTLMSDLKCRKAQRVPYPCPNSAHPQDPHADR
jgi:hypothetical protein